LEVRSPAGLPGAISRNPNTVTAQKRTGELTTNGREHTTILKILLKGSLVLLATLTFIATAHARIGDSLAECRAQYGHEVKAEAAWCGGTAYGFKSSGLYVYAIIGADGKVNDVSYFDNTKVAPLSSPKQESLWKQNQGDKVYENSDLRLWNGRKEYKKQLGQEHGEHWVEYSWDGKEALVMNPSRNDGFQIRSLKEFDAEQKIIKSEAKGDVKVGAITQTK